MKRKELPSIPVEIRLTETQYRVLQIQATKYHRRPDEEAQHMIAELLDQLYGDGVQKY